MKSKKTKIPKAGSWQRLGWELEQQVFTTAGEAIDFLAANQSP